MYPQDLAKKHISDHEKCWKSTNVTSCLPKGLPTQNSPTFKSTSLFHKFNLYVFKFLPLRNIEFLVKDLYLDCDNLYMYVCIYIYIWMIDLEFCFYKAVVETWNWSILIITLNLIKRKHKSHQWQELSLSRFSNPFSLDTFSHYIPWF